MPVNSCKIAADYLQVTYLAPLPPGQVRVSCSFLGLPALELSSCGIPNHHHFYTAPIIGTSLSVIAILISSSSLKLHFHTVRNLLSLYLLIKILSSCGFLLGNVSFYLVSNTYNYFHLDPSHLSRLITSSSPFLPFLLIQICCAASCHPSSDSGSPSCQIYIFLFLRA